MTYDLEFQRECHAFVIATLGVTSDDAAAYYACSECGARWGHLTIQDQQARTWCHSCLEPARPTEVEPIRPEWWQDQIPPGCVDIWASDADVEDDSPPAETRREWEDRIGEMVHLSALQTQKRRGARGRLNYTHIARAARNVRLRLIKEENREISTDELKRLRKTWVIREKGKQYYRNKKLGKK